MTALPSVAHVLVPYIRTTENFIYDRLIHHDRYEPFVLTDESPRNTDLLPFSPIISLAERGAFSRKKNTLVNRITGESPFYVDELKQRRPAVVHAHYGPVGAAVMASAQAAGIPLVVSFYGIDASAFLDDATHMKNYKRMFAGADIISVLSSDMADALAAAGCPREKIRVHHLAVDTSKYKPKESPRRKSARIVSVGRFVPKKGFFHLIESFRIVAGESPETELHLYGSGPMEEDAKRLVAEKGLSNKVIFHGHRPRPEIMDAIADADIFTLFSITAPDGDKEGTPTVLIEAGALGKPSVSTLHAGIPEVVADGETGHLVPEKDEIAFAQKLLSLVKEEETRLAMGAAARDKIVREFDIHSVMKEIENTYEEISKS